MALSYLRDWAKKHTTDPAVIEVLGVIERCAGDRRPTIANGAESALSTIMWSARHAGTLPDLWQSAKSAGLTRAAAALAPPSEQSTDTAKGVATRLLARGEGAALRAELARAKADRARELAGAIHGEATRKDVAAGEIAVAVTDAVAHRDAVVRFAAIDAAAIASARAACDLSAHVPALVAALAEKGKPGLAPGSGTWQSSGTASSARRALGHAVRWPASRPAAVAALRPMLDARAKLPAQKAAYAIAWGSARGDDWSVVDELLGSAKPAVREGAVEALVDTYNKSDLVEVPSRLARRIAGLRRDPVAAVVKLASRVKVAAGADAGAADPRVLAEGLRSDSAAERRRAIQLLKPVVGERGVIDAIAPWLVDAMGTEDREDVLQLIERGPELDRARWAPLLAGVLLDGDWPTARPCAARLLGRTDTAGRPWKALVP